MGLGHLTMSRSNLKFKTFSEGCGLGHLTMSRSNLKFKTFQWGWRAVFSPYPGQIWNLKISVRVGGFGILPCTGQISNKNFWWGWGVSHLSLSRPNLKFQSFNEGLGSRLNLKFKSFSEGWGLGHLTMSTSNLKLIFLVRVGISHHSLSRPNLKFKSFSEGWGLASYHVQAKSEIRIFGEGGG